ncbi:MAG: type II secretion system protein [Planctomycetota bacterium]|nr:type II secretion system protein [Planctomycetota bacterium]MEC8653528.1 type II secretion system protein [Planctomycetota bacterium]MEC9048551.1 type II secretion system protein [Planctomycetota bacterium]
MAERPLQSSEGGFTLAEMLAALGILLFGVTALLGALSSSISQRRTTDARHELTALCDLAMHRVRYESIRSTTGDSSPFDLEFVPLEDQEVAGFPGMTWSASAVEDENRPLLWLVRIDVKWLEEGDEIVEQFIRIVPKQLPMRDRVLSYREGSGSAPR